MPLTPLAFHHRRRHGRQEGGFSLMEVILVTAIIMIVASIMIPHLINAVHKARQRRTMADLNSLGTAWMSWLTDQVGAASAGAQKLYPTDDFINVTYQELYSYLHPSSTFYYMDTVPDVDGWGSQVAFYRNPNGLSDSQLMVCASARDNVFDDCDISQPIAVGPFLATDFDTDIIWADDFFVRWPDAKSGANDAP